MTASGHAQPLLRRTRLLTVMVAAPTILVALGISAIEGSRIHNPRSSLFRTPVVLSLADAIESGDVLRAYEFIRAGQDPNAWIPVRHAVLSGGRTVLVSPLMWATAAQNKQAVLMLLGAGARLDRAPDKAAACVADALGNAEIASLLRQYGNAPPPERCQPAAFTHAPLLSVLGDAEGERGAPSSRHGVS